MGKIVKAIILLLLFIQLVPPLFSKGGIFDIVYITINDCGMPVVKHGLYFDNAWFTLAYLLFSFLGIVVPFLWEKLPRLWKWVSMAVGGWYLSCLTVELINLAVPDIIINNGDDRSQYVIWIMFFIVTLSSIITYETWIKQKR